ncbi:lipopolysaccharide assembly protein LapA domain-containing protein [Vulcaniibacterium gelatinicum]|uniref:lipopolysaccharide assembly protein LapA domain-containing protein n=1 Tax=Vulcaniibacterium gelatinicum TaxID=2598725 RepID=UPI0011C747ED|nr:LapA family protein [Vulcaniibacterium gelatinicum]
MRLIRILIALACLAAGIIVGALNTQSVWLDLGFTRLHSSLGVTVLAALLAGVLVGGLSVAAGVVLPLRRRIRQLEAGRVTSVPPDQAGT